MSIETMSLVWKHAKVEGSELLALLALADHANDEGYCWPSLGTIAQKVRISRSQITRVLKSLEEKGYISRQRRYNPDNGAYASTMYKVNIETLLHPRNNPCCMDATTLVAPTQQPLLHPRDTNHHINHNNNHKERESQPTEDQLESMIVLLETILGYPVTPQDEPAVKVMLEIGAIEEDIRNAVAFFAENQTVARGTKSILKSVRYYVGKRTQAANRRPTKPTNRTTGALARAREELAKDGIEI
jgi:DNA-binding transcriptional MocR family regulator